MTQGITPREQAEVRKHLTTSNEFDDIDAEIAKDKEEEIKFEHD
jgi:hypothetical protein